MMKQFLLLIWFFSITAIWGQTEDAWVYFTDKPQANTYLANPMTMLSQRALDRRTRLNINLDDKDVPVDNIYYSQIAQSSNITIVGKSKWLNAVHVQGYQSIIQNLANLSFVDHIEFANKNIGIISRSHQPVNKPAVATRSTTYDYGAADNQVKMLHGEVMHQHNYTGQGVLIGIIDAGFIDVNNAQLYQHLFQNNKIKDVYNFVGHDQNVYQYSMHGAGVLSTIASQSNGFMVGTAPDVSVALYVSEDISQEMPIEETNWAEAAERADSLGVDVINTSLGYTTFDRPEYSYTMEDLDGQTSFVSRAASIAVSRGINVVVSAGNSGGTSWPKIGMPGDVATVITVGAVDAFRQRAYFSSIGPTADERIKPDVMAQGEGAAVYWDGQIQNLNGTSFSAPIIAGMVACMVQAYPNKTPAQIKLDLISISDRFNNPDNQYGFGIPNFSLYNVNTVAEHEQSNWQLYPNPAQQYIYLKKYALTTYQIYTTDGKLIQSGQTQKQIDISHLSKGMYYFKTQNSTQKFLVK